MKLLTLLHHRFDLWTAPAWFSERLRKDFPQIDIEQFNDYKVAEPHLADADVIVTWSLRPEQVRAAKKLRWVHSPAAAVHQLMIPEILNSDIVVTNASAVHGAVVAEHVIALVLAMAKRIPSLVRYQQKHEWSQQQLWNEHPRPREVSGATLGLVGLGSIGTEVARRALALDMRIVAIREHPERELPAALGSGPWVFQSPFSTEAHDSGICAEQPAARIAVYGTDDLERMLSTADYVVLAAPQRESTRALINAVSLAKMKKDAYLINVARGPLVDESALVEALRRGLIAGAALDVFDTEPLPATSPLWDLPNVLITPHSAALTEQLWERHYAMISDNLRRFLAGDSLESAVDKCRGY